MSAQGMISIVDQEGITYVKIVCDCNGSAVDDVIKELQEGWNFDRCSTLDYFNIARRHKMGCHICLAVIDRDQICSYQKPPYIYAETFPDPRFNPCSPSGKPEIYRILNTEFEVIEVD